MKQVVAYIRVSTQRQGESGFGLNAQRAQIEKYAELKGYRIRRFFTEVASAMPDHLNGRPQLTAALREARANKQPLLVASMDRLTRSKPVFEKLRAKKIAKIEIANLDPKANTITLRSEAARAQREGEMISQRTKEALAQAKRSGTILGNRTNLPAAQVKGTAENARLAAQRMGELRERILEVQAMGASTASSIAAALNRMGVLTARGGPWTKENVHRVLRTTGLKKPAHAASKPPKKAIFTPEKRLSSSGAARLQSALDFDGFSVGDLMRHLGYPALDASLGNAMRQGWQIKSADKINKITAWVESLEAAIEAVNLD